MSEDEEEPQTYALSPWFQQIVWKLLEVTDRYEMIKQLYVTAPISAWSLHAGHELTDCGR